MYQIEPTRQALIADVDAGRRVVVVTGHRAGADVLSWLTAGYVPDDFRVYRAAGRRRIENPIGGHLVVTTEAGARGHSPDLWVLHHSLDVEDWTWVYCNGRVDVISLEPFPDPATTRCPAPV